MITVNPEYVVDEHQKRKAVLVTTDEWEQIVSELEELDDIRAYDAAKSHTAEKIPFEQAVCEIQQGYQEGSMGSISCALPRSNLQELTEARNPASLMQYTVSPGTLVPPAASSSQDAPHGEFASDTVVGYMKLTMIDSWLWSSPSVTERISIGERQLGSRETLWRRRPKAVGGVLKE